MSSNRAISGDQQLRHRVREMINVMQQVESIICVAVAALDHQSTDRDSDIARVLQRTAGDRISVEIEKTRPFVEGAATPGAAIPAPRKHKHLRT